MRTPHMAGGNEVAMFDGFGNIGDLALENDELIIEQLFVLSQARGRFEPDARGLVIKALADQP